jgi:hypothetical protein
MAANSFTSRLEKDTALALRTHPGEVAEEGDEIPLEETHTPGSCEFAVVAFCALHRLPP